MHRALALLITVTACTDDPAPSGPDVTSHVSTLELPMKVPPKLDLVIGVGATGHPLGHLIEQTVDQLGDGFPDIRVATTSSDTVLELKRDLFGETTQSFTGSLGDAIDAELTSPATQILSAIQSEASFSRADAYLGVVTLANTDDNSPDADYAAMLKATKSDPARFVAIGIYARPAPRLDAFHAAFPNRNTYVSIDDTDYAPAFAILTQLAVSTLELPCVPTPLDLDPNAPGDQLDCDVSAFSEANVEIERLPRCGSAADCWDVVANPSCMEGVELQIHGKWRSYRPKIRWQCVTK